MAKSTDKKAAKEASNTFHNIMAASVKGNPKPKKKEWSYPNENPQFSVKEIEGGYKFSIYKENEIVNQFSIDKKTVETKHAATGYEGDEAMAIEIFRKKH